MSKKKNKKKNTAPKKKRKNLKPLIAWLSVLLVIVLIVGISYIVYYNTSLQTTDFANTHWKSVTAYNDSNKKVSIIKVYNNYYDNYQGSMELKGDGTFTFWMNVGDPNDGTHNGSYTYNRDSQILNATFGNGEKTKFKIIRNEDNTIDHIEAPYDGYTVWFYKN